MAPVIRRSAGPQEIPISRAARRTCSSAPARRSRRCRNVEEASSCESRDQHSCRGAGGDHRLMAESGFDERIAQRYEKLWPELFDDAMIAATVSVLAGLADTKPALEFGVGTGRIGLPLSRAGVEVHGIDLSPAMIARLRAQPGGSVVHVTVGDFATVTVGEDFGLVYLLRNTI